MITAATYHKSLGTINVITSDHYINLYKVEDLAVHKQVRCQLEPNLAPPGCFLGFNGVWQQIQSKQQNEIISTGTLKSIFYKGFAFQWGLLLVSL